MEFKKSDWAVGQDKLSLSVPLTKVDTENRIVMGFATLDNTDQHDEVVTQEASLEAFDGFRGNIREMHQPIAVGKMISFREDEFFDAKNNKLHRGIFVKVYVSTGAESTWQKVLDGTLTGFSIGGDIKEAKSEVIKDAGAHKVVRYITKYRLTELSLVDSPANQFANVFSVVKVDGHNEATGILTETEMQNVFFCETDDIAKAVNATELECSACDKPMKVVGWIEKDSNDSVTKMADVIQKFKGGVENMPEETNKEEAVVVDETVVPEEVAVTEVLGGTGELPEELEERKEQAEEAAAEKPADEKTEKSDTVSVDEVSTADLEELVKSLTSKVEEMVASNKDAGENYSVIQKGLDEVKTELSELSKGHTELNKSLSAVEANLADVMGKIEKSDSKSAFKKSADVESAVTNERSSSVWSNSPISFR